MQAGPNYGLSPRTTLTNTLLIDFNGDGLPDLVTGGNAVGADPTLTNPACGTGTSTTPNPSITVRLAQTDSSGKCARQSLGEEDEM
jgi:hypothetical protein